MGWLILVLLIAWILISPRKPAPTPPRSPAPRAPQPPADPLDAVEEALARADLDGAAELLVSFETPLGPRDPGRHARARALLQRLGRLQADQVAALVRELQDGPPPDRVDRIAGRLERLLRRGAPDYLSHLPEPLVAQVLVLRSVLIDDGFRPSPARMALASNAQTHRVLIALLQARDTSLRERAAALLARLGPSPELWAGLLDSAEDALARADVEAAGDLLATLSPLIERNPSERARSLQERLARLQGDRACSLVQSLSGELSSEQVGRTARELGRLFAQALPGYLNHVPEAMAARVLVIRSVVMPDDRELSPGRLALADNEETHRAVAALLRVPDPGVRWRAGHSLARFELSPALWRQLLDPVEGALARGEVKVATDRLAAIRPVLDRDRRPWVRALQAGVARLQGDRVAALVQRLGRDLPPEQAEETVRELDGLFGQALPGYTGDLPQDAAAPIHAVRWVVTGEGLEPPPESLDALAHEQTRRVMVTLLRVRNVQLRQRAARVLVGLDLPPRVWFLLLNDPDPELQLMAASSALRRERASRVDSEMVLSVLLKLEDPRASRLLAAHFAERPDVRRVLERRVALHGLAVLEGLLLHPSPDPALVRRALLAAPADEARRVLRQCEVDPSVLLPALETDDRIAQEQLADLVAELLSESAAFEDAARRHPSDAVRAVAARALALAAEREAAERTQRELEAWRERKRRLFGRELDDWRFDR